MAGSIKIVLDTCALIWWSLDPDKTVLKKSDVIRIIPIDEEIWLESVKLEWEHRDPVDRVVVAVAKKNEASIITSDRKIANFYSLVIW
ncbi:PIN domain-containing protein [Plectonema radiosum NIES-515]|uniref:PIN domain-containing protein n=1 Tax=Plectonema radiosum NIES-515 TaxID=2986073 RepID=A0ABT3B4K7_9CYAN|nr:PIN domain-containing protein [Plectonema radiosum]MCV3216302.1 PIN domain-containing protein [Plectonema radiosum NIES-515]